MAGEERRLVRGLAVFVVRGRTSDKDAHVVCAPGLTSRLGLSSWPAMYPEPSQVGNVTHDLFVRCYAFVRLTVTPTGTVINSHCALIGNAE